MSGEADHVLGVCQSLTGRHWLWRPADPAVVSDLIRRCGISDLVARLLAGRGVSGVDAAEFLRPRLKTSFPDPSSFADMDRASAGVFEAVREKRKCAIIADYDADGGCAAAVLIRYLRHFGIEPVLHVPDRFDEGYGPSVKASSALKAAGVELVITVDCGANAHDALVHAADTGLEVIVLDHHLMQGDMPPARAIVNPNRPDCGSGCGYLAGVGVVLVLIVAVNRIARSHGIESVPDPRQWLDICAVGTICDVVPLTGLNRAIVTHGLRRCRVGTNPGVAALATRCGITHPRTTEDIAFGLGPRLNAGGRVGDRTLGARLLTCDDPDQVAAIADRLEATNVQRKAIEAEITVRAIAKAEKQCAAWSSTGIVTVAEQGWHPGVLGITAARLRDRFYRPCVVIGWGGEFGPLARGSARSVPGVPIGDIVARAKKLGLVDSGGGHATAAGLSLTPENIPALIDYLADPAHVPDSAHRAARGVTVDAVIATGSARCETLDHLDALAPFGAGFPAPVVALPHVRADGARRVGRNHVAFTAHGRDGGKARCIAFGHADGPVGRAVFGQNLLHLAGRLGPDRWRGSGAVQFEVTDASLAEQTSQQGELRNQSG